MLFVDEMIIGQNLFSQLLSAKLYCELKQADNGLHVDQEIVISLTCCSTGSLHIDQEVVISLTCCSIGSLHIDQEVVISLTCCSTGSLHIDQEVVM